MRIPLNRPLRAAFLLFSLLLLQLPAARAANPVTTKVSTTGCQLLKAETIETKGIIEPLIELVNGSSFQQSIHYFKKSGSAGTVIDPAAALLHYFYGAQSYHLQHAHCLPLYLAHRNIRI